MLAYFKLPWPEEPVPDDCPDWLYCEVEKDRDVVTRTVEVFADGRVIRNSIALAARDGLDVRPPEYQSLVYGPFLTVEEDYAGVPADAEISVAEFDEAWNVAIDKPLD